MHLEGFDTYIRSNSKRVGILAHFLFFLRFHFLSHGKRRRRQSPQLKGVRKVTPANAITKRFSFSYCYKRILNF